jgi:hypothetical protein
LGNPDKKQSSKDLLFLIKSDFPGNEADSLSRCNSKDHRIQAAFYAPEYEGLSFNQSLPQTHRPAETA